MSYTGEEPKFLTQPPADNSTKVATTGYVDAAIAAAASGWLSSIESISFNAVVSTVHILTVAVNATLPDPALGGQIILKDDSGNGFTITPFGAELIEGQAGLFTVAPTRSSFMLASDGTNWHITSSYIGTTPIFNTMSVNDHIILGQATNAATGANAAVTLAAVSPIVELNDPGLVSIDTITGVDQATLFLFNNTGANITLNDQTGSPSFEQILTGEGANVVLKQGYVAHLIYLGGFWVLLNIKAAITDPLSQVISALNINWSLGNIFYKSISANSTFTFSNVTDGKTISVVVINTSGAAVTVTLPAGIKVPSGFVLSVPAGKANVYTFMRANSITYASYVEGLV